jgi:phosphotransferase system HPr (HPr) family protein
MDGQTASRKVIVTNPQGLHARPADLFVKTATRFQARVEVIKGSERVDGKSILAVLTLASVQGTELVIEAAGPDAQAAVDALVQLVAQNFSEGDS